MIGKKLVISLSLLLLAFVLGSEALPVVATKQEVATPTEFKEVGVFRVTKAVLTQLGKTTEVEKGDLILQVFTDGIDVRISPLGQDDDFLAFQIYQSGSIFEAGGKNSIPGVQAFSDQGEVVRHLVLHKKLLTITKFPTSTSDVEIVYATRYER